MKTKILLFATAILMAMNLRAQAPEKFNYQGIARDNTGAPLANQALGLQISILNPANTALYVETHNVNTNDFGLYSLAIGNGTVVSGTFGSINWAGNPKKIKVEIDPNGGTNYTDLGTTELLSVPYALYASESVWEKTGNDVVYSGGNVGIGGTNPVNVLEVNAAVPSSSELVNFIATSMVSSDDILQLTAPSGASGYQFIEADDGSGAVFSLNDDGSIESDGKITLSLDSSTPNPHILIDETSTDFGRISFENNNTGFWTLAGKPGSTEAASEFNIYYNSGTSGINVLSAQGDGKVGIGTTSPDEIFHVVHAGVSTPSGLDGFKIEHDTSPGHDWVFHVGNSSGDLYMFADGSQKGKFDAVTGSYTTSSDARLKAAIQPLEPTISKVMELTPLTYKFKNQENNERHLGFIAQEVEKIFPSVAKEPSKEDGSEYYTMDYSAFGVIAIKAIQEQQKIIEDLRERVAKLEQAQND